MKALLTLIFIGMGTLICSAQTEAGRALIAGNSSFNFTSQSRDGIDENTSTLGITLAAGSFVVDGLAAGIMLEYESVKFRDDKTQVTLIGAFLRYYVENKAFFGAGYSLATSTIESGSFESSFNGGALNFEAGVPIWVSDMVAVEPSVNYVIGSGELLDGINTLNINLGLSLFLN